VPKICTVKLHLFLETPQTSRQLNAHGQTNTENAMSSEFDQYFQEFLADDSNEFDIFKDDFSSEPEGLHRGDDGQLQDRAESSFDSIPLEDLEDPSLSPLIRQILLYGERRCCLRPMLALGEIFFF
jgi:hypothetical protein